MKILTPLLYIALSLLVFFWYIKPGYQEIKTIREQGVLYSDALAQVALAAEKRDEVSNKFNSISSNDIKRLEKLLPDKVDTLQLAVDINALARKYGSAVKGIKLSSSQTDNADTTGGVMYGTTPIEFAVTMGYENFLRFLADLEQSLKLVDVANVSFRPETSDKTAGGYTYNVSLTAYYLK